MSDAGEVESLTFAWEDPDSVSSEWDRLALTCEASPFMRPGWHLAWQRSFGRTPMWVRTARSNEGELVACLPLARRARIISSPTNWHTPLFEPVASDDVALTKLIESLRNENRRRRLNLSFLPSSALSEPWMKAMPGRTEHRLLMESPYVEIDGDWEQFQNGLSGKLRGNVRRCRKKLADLGRVALQVESGGDDLDSLLTQCFELEASGWKGDRGSAIISSPETRDFYHAVAHWAGEHGILCLALLKVDDEVVAFHLCLEDAGRHYLLKLGHDARLDRAGPGMVLIADMIERSFREGQRTYEFLGSAATYKMRWATGCRERFEVQSFAPGIQGAVDRFVQVRARSAARGIHKRMGDGRAVQELRKLVRLS